MVKRYLRRKEEAYRRTLLPYIVTTYRNGAVVDVREMNHR